MARPYLPHGRKHQATAPCRLRAPSPALLLARAALTDPTPLSDDERARIEREAAAVPYRDTAQLELVLPLAESALTP